jgi:hypothetical protein
VAFSGFVLAYPYWLREPDPYAYRASIKALEDGHLTLTQAQFVELGRRLRAEPDRWDGVFQPAPVRLGSPPEAPPQAPPLPGRAAPREGFVPLPSVTKHWASIECWVKLANSRWVSEKNPGYPFLAAPFDALGAIRIAPLFYGALACLCLWLGATRWIGRWGAGLAVALYLCPAAMLIMGHRAYMPSFTDASLLSGGAGLLLWGVLAVEASRRRRALGGTLGFFLLGVSVATRYTNVFPALAIALWAAISALRPRAALGWRVLLSWTAGALLPSALLLLYNLWVFRNPAAVGYEQSRGSGSVFFLWNVGHNLEVMPSRILRGMPSLVLALAALLTAAGRGVVAWRRRGAPPLADPFAPDAATSAATAPSSAASVSGAGWVQAMLLLWWIAAWAPLLFFGWTWSSVPASWNLILTVRFYIPAVGAIALLGAWFLARLPKGGAIVLVALFFVLGVVVHVDAITGDRLFGQRAPRVFPAGDPPALHRP